MRSITATLSAAVVSAAMLAACSGGDSGSPALPLGFTRDVAQLVHRNVTEQVVYSFGGGSSDGAFGESKLLKVGNVMFGTTYGGGNPNCQYGCGTVFRVTPGGSEHVLHVFGGPPDGQYPYTSGLINVGGVLYGTTSNGGAYGKGCVYTITQSGTENVIYSFGGYSGDGTHPAAGLLNVGGTLYGTTNQGGSNGYGTVFSITTGGIENVIYSFGGYSGDGEFPAAALTYLSGKMWSTTSEGGIGAGTVYSVTLAGSESVVHSFTGGDGEYPYSRLTPVNGVFRGTTSRGGSHGVGTVFKVKQNGTEQVVYNFAYGSEGFYPSSGLLNVNGTLYGTTAAGGTSSEGTVFKVAPNGTLTTLYSFGYLPDASLPVSDLIDLNGTLYGTTAEGGSNGDGAVYSITP